jgi:circadian clock protein KaiB
MVAVIDRFCQEHLPVEYSLEVVVAEENPDRLMEDRVFALPTLVRKNPGPVRRLVGNLNQANYLAVALGVAVAKTSF